MSRSLTSTVPGAPGCSGFSEARAIRAVAFLCVGPQHDVINTLP